MKRRSLLFLLLLLAAVLGLRLHWFASFQQSPLFQSPAVDEALHWSWANSLATGSGSPEIPYFRAPLYPWYLSLLHHLPGGLAQVRAVGVLLGLFNLWLLVGFVGSFLPTRARWWLLALGGLDACWIYFEPMLLIPHLLICCLLLCTGLLLRADAARERKRLLLALASGLALGLACIARPNALLLTPLLPLLLWRQKAEDPTPKRRWPVLLAVLGLLLPIALVAGINGWPRSGVLLASQGGVNFYIGNNASADGHTASLPGVGNTWERADASMMAARADLSENDRQPDPGEESDWFYAEGRKWLLEHPVDGLRLYARKLQLLLAPVTLGSNTNPLALSARSPLFQTLLRFSWWLVLLPGLLGLALGFPRHRLLRHWCLATLGLWSLSLLLFFINSRFRLPLHPFLMLPAAALLAEYHRVPALLRQRARLFTCLVILLLLPLSALTLPKSLYHANTSWQMLQEGNAWLRLDEKEKAARCFRDAIAVSPELPGPRLNLGRMYHMEGDFAQAAEWYGRELEVDSSSAECWNNLASMHLSVGRYEEARLGFLRALRYRPAHKDANWNLGLCYAHLALQQLDEGDTSQAHLYQEGMLRTSYDGLGVQQLAARLPTAADVPTGDTQE